MQPRILALIASLALINATAFAANDSFLGKWKLNPGKSQFNGLTYKVADAGPDKYTFTFGDDSETMILGKEHLTKYGNTWLVTKNGPNSWKWTRKRKGKITSDAIWSVSKDGATSTYVSTEMRPDGSTSHDETRLKRTAGTSGLSGTWVSTRITVGSPNSIEMAKWQADGYAMMNPTYQEQTAFRLDGKDYTPKGPRVAKGTTVSAKAIDSHNMELSYKLKGKATETDHWKLSSNGRILTDTINFSGESKPEVDVYDRK